MVEVIKKIRYEATCKKCGSDLGYSYEDTSYDKFLYTYSIVCPVCDNEIRVNDPNLDDQSEE